MGAPKFLADLLFNLGRLGTKFTRKKTPEQQRAEDAKHFGRNHFPNIKGNCVYCDKEGASEAEACPGPLIR